MLDQLMNNIKGASSFQAYFSCLVVLFSHDFDCVFYCKQHVLSISARLAPKSFSCTFVSHSFNNELIAEFLVGLINFNSIILIYNMPIFVFHQPRLTEKIGVDCSTHSRLCCEHNICASLLTEDVIEIFRRLQILVDGKEKSVIVAYHVSDGIDRCCWLPQKQLTRFSGLYKGVLAQVSSMQPGSFVAVIISCLPE